MQNSIFLHNLITRMMTRKRWIRLCGNECSEQRGFRQIPELGEGATFLRKWGFIGILIGIGAGLGALVLTWFIGVVNHFVLGTIVGYTPPLPGR